ncbi:MAG: SynChlorMet cassette radical SAM/SPASM protein ScmE [Syntrophales bacterium]
MKIMSTPRDLDLSITGRCNLRCAYCSHFTSASDVDNDLPAEEWLDFFSELGRCSVMSVTLQGGEPFCRDDFREIVLGIIRNRMRFSILSNGTLITDDLASFLAETGRCDNVQVSIDGSTPVTHDAFRGNGSFKKAVRGIEYLQKHRVPVSARVTVHKRNVRELGKIARMLLEDMGIRSISTNSAAHMGLCRFSAEQIQLSVEEKALAMKVLLELDLKYPGLISATAGPLADGKTWIAMEKARVEGKETIPGRGCLSGCGATMSQLAVRADGVIVPCSQLSHIELGRINQVDLKELWLNHPELKRLRERYKIALTDFPACRDCVYVRYCTGNCPALSYTYSGNYCEPSPDACLRRFLEKGGQLPVRIE